MRVFSVPYLQVPTTHVMDLDENRNAFTQEVQYSPGSTTIRDLLRHGAMRFSGRAGAEHSSSMKR